MTKTSPKVIASAPLELPYPTPESMPWPAIEAAMKRKYSDQDRSEIHRCSVRYYAWRSVTRDAVPVSEVEKLRVQIVKPAQALVALVDRYRPPTGARCSQEDESAFLALALSLSDDFELTSTLRHAAEACRPLVDALSDKQIDYDKTSQNAEVIGLAHFVAEAVKGASQKSARSNPGYRQNPTALEHHRWGMHLSPQRGDLPTFTSAVLGRPVSAHQIQHAFKVARDLGLIDRQE